MSDTITRRDVRPINKLSAPCATCGRVVSKGEGYTKARQASDPLPTHLEAYGDRLRWWTYHVTCEPHMAAPASEPAVSETPAKPESDSKARERTRRKTKAPEIESASAPEPVVEAPAEGVSIEKAREERAKPSRKAAKTPKADKGEKVAKQSSPRGPRSTYFWLPPVGSVLEATIKGRTVTATVVDPAMGLVDAGGGPESVHKAAKRASGWNTMPHGLWFWKFEGRRLGDIGVAEAKPIPKNVAVSMDKQTVVARGEAEAKIAAALAVAAGTPE